MTRFGIFLIVLVVAHIHCAPQKIEISIEHKEVNYLYPRAVTEPAWVTELLGPTQFPVSSTKRPTLPQRIRETIKTINQSINQFPVRINQIFEGIQKGAQNIIGGPGGPRTTTKPNLASTRARAAAPLSQLIKYFQKNVFFAPKDVDQSERIQKTSNEVSRV
ncbi:uncharacterized protein LOC110847265 [Folsomia candida]|uniref:uncharacterized protein LOC110847265 n=1 Tax=Folsomia candida TaxID=158441 RepID=UPI000B9009AE|nr:uncharacterized protein LOC110847265 [Folsomia candida]